MDYKQEVLITIQNKPRLTPIFTSTHLIPERIREYNPRLFICYNNVTNKFEIHSLDQEDSHCADLPYRHLDARAIRYIWENDIRVHGMNLFRKLEQNEQLREESLKRDQKNYIQAFAREARSLFAKDAWVGG